MAAGSVTKIGDLLAEGPTLSVEFFPPKSEEGFAQLKRTIDELEAADPSFVSVTYGAGGTTRDTTRNLVVEINRDRSFPAMAHLTCMGHARAELGSLVDDYAANGVDNILALAGDPPADGTPASGDFSFASELVELIRELGDFSVGVAAHPEVHPRSPDRAEDRRRLAAKLSSADFGITQFFFSADDYFQMVDEMAELGCTTPVIPGIMPLLNTATIRRFAALSGASFPEDLAAAIDGASSADQAFDIALDAATELCAALLDRGVPGLHVYCLNRAPATLALVERLGLR